GQDRGGGARAPGDGRCGPYRDAPARELPACERHQPGLETAGVEARLEGEPHVPRAVQVAHDERRVHEPIVFRESRTRRLSRLQGLEDDARGEYSRLDRV